MKAAESFKAYGGEPVLRGKLEMVLAGAADFDAVGIVRFPDRRAAEDWYHGEQYQALIPLRDEAVEMVLTVFSDLA